MTYLKFEITALSIKYINMCARARIHTHTHKTIPDNLIDLSLNKIRQKKFIYKKFM